MTEDHLQEVIRRVESMELRFDALQKAYLSNSEIVHSECWFKEELQILRDYYEDGNWLSDYELDEKGALPSKLKRGVLSQDAVFNFLTEVTDEWRRCSMKVLAYSQQIEDYLDDTDVVNYDNGSIGQLAEMLFENSESNLEYIKVAYEYVRDHISHSADINEDLITCSASEVLAAGHGICFAKAHLLAALLRYKGIPTGFCYQKLILDDDAAPVLIYHGLNGVYIKEIDKWIRLDARGNKEGVDAQFSLDEEQLAFPIRPEKGEIDDFVVYPAPDANVLKSMRKSKTRSELWENLPTELKYHDKNGE